MKQWMFILLTFVLLIPFSFGQNKKKLNSNGAGTIFGEIGYNRSMYGSSAVELQGKGYNLLLSDVFLSDNKEGTKLGKYFGSSSPQISAKLGFYVANSWAITVGYDQYNTFFSTPQNVHIEGTFAPLSNSTYEGTYDEEIPLSRDEFNLQQLKGMHFISLGFHRNDQWFKSRDAAVAIQTLYGVKLGMLASSVDYTYDHNTTTKNASINGFGLAANVGVKFDFFQYLFLEIGFEGGYLAQNKIQISGNKDDVAKQKQSYIAPKISIGFNIFARPVNLCGTCPEW